MGRQIIELVQVLVDRIEDAAARQQKDFRHLDEEIERRKAAEKDRDHWRQARQDAIAAGELMQAEIVSLRQQLAEARRQDSARLLQFAAKVREAVKLSRLGHVVYGFHAKIDAALAELDAQRAPVAETAEGGT